MWATKTGFSFLFPSRLSLLLCFLPLCTVQCAISVKSGLLQEIYVSVCVLAGMRSPLNSEIHMSAKLVKWKLRVSSRTHCDCDIGGHGKFHCKMHYGLGGEDPKWKRKRRLKWKEKRMWKSTLSFRTELLIADKKRHPEFDSPTGKLSRWPPT